VVSQLQGDFDTADGLYQQVAALFAQLGELRALQIAIGTRGTCALERGDYARARTLLEESLGRARELGYEHGIGDASYNLGLVTLHERRYEESIPLFVESLDVALRHGRRTDIPLLLRCLSAPAAVRGELEAGAGQCGGAHAPGGQM